VDLKRGLTHGGAEYRLRVFMNHLLGIIYRPKRQDVTGGWIKFHNEKYYVNVSKNKTVNNSIFLL
jgi:hypothetical protein